MNSVKEYINQNKELMLTTLKELCHIPAPSHFEDERARYCKEWLDKAGAKGVYVDEAKNVVFPFGCMDKKEITVFAAHTDTVFPDREPMPYLDDGQRVHCPGASDDTASVVVLMLMAKYFVENDLPTDSGILFVCNSCEEGLGNLKGTRQIFNDYENRIARFITFDSSLNIVCDRCVGSHRYEVEVITEGGHSFNDFGNDNAIAKLSEMISDIYRIKVPEKEGSTTTYNVGIVSGGTSVNTIAQNAKMLCEYRSDDKECLEIMRLNFENIFEKARAEKITVDVKKVGDRPCADIDCIKTEKLKSIVIPVIEELIGEKVIFESGSTDCNIPLSIGVPALAVGVNMHAGVHTREEWVDKKSMETGLELAIKLGLELGA